MNRKILITLLATLHFSAWGTSGENWVGLYKHQAKGLTIAIDQCHAKGCRVSFVSGSAPGRTYLDCPKSFRFNFKKNSLQYSYTDINDEKRTASFRRLSGSGNLDLTDFGLFPEFAQTPVCTWPDGPYDVLFSKSSDPELEKLLPVCKELNDKDWIELCQKQEHRKFLTLFLQKSKMTQSRFLDMTKKEYYGENIRSEGESLSTYLAKKIVNLYGKDHPDSRTIKTFPFQGSYKTQLLTFSEGLRNWYQDFYFENCVKDVCDYVSKLCEGLSYGSSQCREERGKSIFESPDVIYIKDICGEVRVHLKKTNDSWGIKDSGCSQIQGWPLLRKQSEVAINIYEAGFDCLQKSLSPVEKTICRSKILSKYDRWMNVLFKKSQNNQNQMIWLRERNLCSEKDIELCLIQSYEKRLVELLN